MATQTSRNESLNTSSNRVVAFFKHKEDAYRVIAELRDQGFTSSDIGVIEGNSDMAAGSRSGSEGGTGEHDSMWQKIKNFFTSDSHEDDADSNYGYDYDESVSGMDWDRNRANYYYQGVNAGGALVSVSGPRVQEARSILQNAGGDLREGGFEDYSGTNVAGSVPAVLIRVRCDALRSVCANAAPRTIGIHNRFSIFMTDSGINRCSPPFMLAS